MNTFYDIGDTISLNANFKLNNLPFDPTAITCKVKQPDLTVLDISNTVIKLSAGRYNANFTAAQLGFHKYEWIVSGSGATAVEIGSLMVSDQAF